jgi:hypothetical protein
MRFASRMMGLSAILVLAFATMTFGQVEIPEGTATVDGDLSDWAGAAWIDADQIYYSSNELWPADVPEGTPKWAAMWSSTTNMIYVAATLEDQNQISTTESTGWDTSDRVEFYVNAPNTDTSPYYWGTPASEGGDMRDAQQWVVGHDGSTGPDDVAGYWATLGGNPIPEGAEPEIAVRVEGTTISYEIAMTPWESLLWVYDDGGSTPLRLEDENSTIVQLAAGVQMGLDVVLGSRDGDNFGMMAENLDGAKYTNAANMLNVTLVEGAENPLGDVNLDGVVNGLDVDPFVGLVTSGGFQTEADMNGDGAVNGLDVDPFVAAVVGGGGAQAVPEPGTLLLALMAGLALIAVGRRK